MKTETELLAIKADIDKAKEAVSGLRGQETALLKQFKEWECDTIEQVEAKLKEMNDSLSDFDNKINKGINELEEKYNGT